MDSLSPSGLRSSTRAGIGSAVLIGFRFQFFVVTLLFEISCGRLSWISVSFSVPIQRAYLGKCFNAGMKAFCVCFTTVKFSTVLYNWSKENSFYSTVNLHFQYRLCIGKIMSKYSIQSFCLRTRAIKQHMYTVNHKKRDILFLTITLANLNRFLHFYIVLIVKKFYMRL